MSPGSVRSLAKLYEERRRRVELDVSVVVDGSNMNHQIYQGHHDHVRTSSASFRPSPASSMSRKPLQGSSSLRNMSPVSSSYGDGASSQHTSQSGSGLASSYNISQIDGTSNYASSTYQSSVYTTPSADYSQQQQVPVSTQSDDSSRRPQPQPQTSASTSSTTTHSRPTGPVNLRPISDKDISSALQKCLSLQNKAVSEHGKQPFTALLLAPDNTTTLAKHFYISHFQHAESELVRLVAAQYSPQYLARCTLVSTWEPCAMCSGGIYWVGIGRVVYGASEVELGHMLRRHNPEGTNMTMGVPCRTVLSSTQRQIEVVGPVSEWEAKIIEESGRYWQTAAERIISVNADTNSSTHSTANLQKHLAAEQRNASISVYNPQDSAYGKIDDDGEYQADLKVDWMF